MDKSVSDAVANAEVSAKETAAEERIKTTEDPRPLLTSDGRQVGTFALGTYAPRKGPVQPVIVEKIGGSTRIVSILTAQAAARTYFGAADK